MQSVLIFIVVASISMIGSLQLGVVNVAVIETALQKRFKISILVALGGSIPEFFYAYLALQGINFTSQFDQYLPLIQLIMSFVLFVLGIRYWFTKSDTVSVYSSLTHIDLLKGFIVGMLNPQLLPFWYLVAIQLQTYFPLQHTAHQVAFVAGTGVGAFIILTIVGYLAHSYKEQIYQFLRPKLINRIVGSIFITIAIWQLGKFLMKMSGI